MNQYSGEPDDGLSSYHHIVNLISDAVLIHSQNQVQVVNEQCLQLFGAIDREQLMHVSLLDLFPPEEHAAFNERRAHALLKREPMPPNATIIRRLDGALVDVENRTFVVPQSNDGLTILEVFRRPFGNEATHSEVRSEIQVRSILDTAMDGIISMDEEQRIVFFNKAAEEIFGRHTEQMLGQSIEVLIPNRFRIQHRNEVERFGKGIVQNRRMGSQRTVMALRASGEEFPIEASISQSTDNGKKIYTAIVRDVTEAFRYRQQIEQQSQMLDQVSDAVSVVDPDGNIMFWNQAACRLFGWTADEVTGQNAYEILYHGDAEVLQHMLRMVRARHSWTGELNKITKSGKKIIVEHRRSVLLNESGAVKGYICIDIDITDQKKQERESRRSQRLESIGTLAGGIAHDLNNVLTPILMGAELLDSNRAGQNQKGVLSTMVASARRGSDLIKQLLAFAGGVRGERSPVEIGQIVNETRGLLEHTLLKSIEIACTVENDCETVQGDATELSQVLTNLCINARDAMPHGGKLTIETKRIQLYDNAVQTHPDARPGPYVALTVSDTGTGMSVEILERIFDPFFTTKDIGKGTGLGLATVQGIVKNHGGFVTVYSELERGSKFSVYLPANAAIELTTDVPMAAIAESGNGHTVLLVDDEVAILQITAAALEGDGYRVLTAQDGPSAISKFTRYRDEISAVILDMMMPGMDGLLTLDQLRRVDPSVAVVACSGLRTSQREAEVLERGAKSFLPKPYSEDELLNALYDVITKDGKQLEHQSSPSP